MTISRTLLEDCRAYEEALIEVLKVRQDRKRLYGEGWRESTDKDLHAMVKEKFGRLTRFVEQGSVEAPYEKKKDTLIDLINWSMFMLQNEIERNKE